jgi:hypothetical protein
MNQYRPAESNGRPGVVPIMPFRYLFGRRSTPHERPKTSESAMQNWIGIAIWIIMGAAIGLMMRAAISRPEEQPGHAQVIMALGAFASVIGGMLGVGIFHLWEPLALSVGGMACAAAFAALMTFIYRWGLRTLI